MEEKQNPYEPTEPAVPEKVEKRGNPFLSCLYWLIVIPLAVLGLIFLLFLTCYGVVIFSSL